jgi:hypothetical protein
MRLGEVFQNLCDWLKDGRRSDDQLLGGYLWSDGVVKFLTKMRDGSKEALKEVVKKRGEQSATSKGLPQWKLAGKAGWVTLSEARKLDEDKVIVEFVKLFGLEAKDADTLIELVAERLIKEGFAKPDYAKAVEAYKGKIGDVEKSSMTLNAYPEKSGKVVVEVLSDGKGISIVEEDGNEVVV